MLRSCEICRDGGAAAFIQSDHALPESCGAGSVTHLLAAGTIFGNPAILLRTSRNQGSAEHGSSMKRTPHGFLHLKGSAVRQWSRPHPRFPGFWQTIPLERPAGTDMDQCRSGRRGTVDQAATEVSSMQRARQIYASAPHQRSRIVTWSRCHCVGATSIDVLVGQDVHFHCYASNRKVVSHWETHTSNMGR